MYLYVYEFFVFGDGKGMNVGSGYIDYFDIVGLEDFVRLNMLIYDRDWYVEDCQVLNVCDIFEICDYIGDELVVVFVDLEFLDVLVVFG